MPSESDYTVERRGCQYCIYYKTGEKVLTVPGFGEKARRAAYEMARKLNKQAKENCNNT